MFDRVRKELESYRTLEEGWCYGEGGPIDAAVVDRAVEIVNYASGLKEITAVECFPGVGHNIVLAFYAGVLACCEIEVELVGGGIKTSHNIDKKVGDEWVEVDCDDSGEYAAEEVLCLFSIFGAEQKERDPNGVY